MIIWEDEKFTMACQTARILEILQMGTTIGGILDLPQSALPSPGQYLPVQRLEGPKDVLTLPLFRVAGPAGQLVMGPLPSHWGPGDLIACLPSHGKGFHLPGSARRVALLSLAGQPLRILPLIEQALGQHAAVSLFFTERPHQDILSWIPSSVEISPVNELSENLDWPDFLAVEAARENLPALNTLLENAPSGFSGQVLVKTEMPCRGVGECGACAVKTRHGWRQACTDGPVFPLKELLHVAG